MPATFGRLMSRIGAMACGLPLLLLSVTPGAHASFVPTPPPIAVQWQVVITPFDCDPFAGQGTCSPFIAMSGTFGFFGSVQGALLSSPVAFDVEGESTHKDHKGEFSAVAGETLSFWLSGSYQPPPPPPGGPVPIPYPLFAYAPGTDLGSDVIAPAVAPLIDLGSLTSASFDPVDLSGPIYAFDAPAQVGNWKVILSPAVPEPATLVLAALGLAGIGMSRRRRAT